MVSFFSRFVFSVLTVDEKICYYCEPWFWLALPMLNSGGRRPGSKVAASAVKFRDHFCKSGRN